MKWFRSLVFLSHGVMPIVETSLKTELGFPNPGGEQQVVAPGLARSRSAFLLPSIEMILARARNPDKGLTWTSKIPKTMDYTLLGPCAFRLSILEVKVAGGTLHSRTLDRGVSAWRHPGSKPQSEPSTPSPLPEGKTTKHFVGPHKFCMRLHAKNLQNSGSGWFT